MNLNSFIWIKLAACDLRGRVDRSSRHPGGSGVSFCELVEKNTYAVYVHVTYDRYSKERKECTENGHCSGSLLQQLGDVIKEGLISVIV